MSDEIIAPASAPSLYALFRERIRRSHGATAYKEYDAIAGVWRDYTWAYISELVDCFRAALAREGLSAGDRVAVLLPNGVDWACFDLAAHSLGLVLVGLYPHETAATNAYILGHSDTRLVLLDTVARWTALAPFASELPSLQRVWVKARPSEINFPPRVDVTYLSEFISGPAQKLPPEYASEPDDVATLIYTSGTTGRPKGVMLSHFALLRNAQAAGSVVPPRPDDIFLSVLPLAHAFERTVGYYLPMMAGCTVAYARSPQELSQDFLAVRPTVMLGVPLLFERMAAAIEAKVVGNFIGRKLLHAAVAAGWSQFLAQQRSSKPALVRSLLWRTVDRLVARRVRVAFGGRLRVAISGGAPLPRNVSRMLLGLGLPIVEGYGLTEAGPVVAANSLADNRPGSVGHPLLGVQVKLGAQGELLVRTPAMMAGYWKDDLRTRETLNPEGWLSTGDVADLDQSGRLFIRGRLTEMIVLSIGEKINPAVVEAELCRDPLFRQAVLVGEGRPFTVAIVVLDANAWQVLAAEQGFDPKNPNGADSKIALLARITAAVAELPRHALPRTCHFILTPWTIEAGLLTPTMKVKRDAVIPLFAKEIDALYVSPTLPKTDDQSGRRTA